MAAPANNFVRDGAYFTVVLGSGETTTRGVPVVEGNLIGVADKDGVAGDSINCYLHGVRTINKTTGTAWTVGQPIFWDATNAKGITTDETGLFLGFCETAAASGDTTGNVILMPGGSGAAGAQVSHSVQTITAGTTGTVTDARVTANSVIHATFKTSTTAGGYLLAVPGSGSYVITARKPADATLENTAAGTVMVTIFY